MEGEKNKVAVVMEYGADVVISINTNRPIGKEDKSLKKPPVFWCAVCLVSLSSPTVAVQHAKGKPHQMKAGTWVNTVNKRKSETEDGAPEPDGTQPVSKKSKEETDESRLKCDDCNLVFTSMKNSLEHYNGKRHATTLRKKQLAVAEADNKAKLESIVKANQNAGETAGGVSRIISRDNSKALPMRKVPIISKVSSPSLPIQKKNKSFTGGPRGSRWDSTGRTAVSRVMSLNNNFVKSSHDTSSYKQSTNSFDRVERKNNTSNNIEYVTKKVGERHNSSVPSHQNNRTPGYRGGDYSNSSYSTEPSSKTSYNSPNSISKSNYNNYDNYNSYNNTTSYSQSTSSSTSYTYNNAYTKPTSSISTGYYTSQSNTITNAVATPPSTTSYNYQYKNYTPQESYYNTSSYSQNSYETPKESYNTRTITPKEYSPALPSQNNNNSSANYSSYNTSDYTWSNYTSISNNNNSGYSANSYYRDSSASSTVNGNQATSTQYSSYYG